MLTGEPLAIDLINTRPADADWLDAPEAWLARQADRLTAPDRPLTPDEMAALRALRDHVRAAVDAVRQATPIPEPARHALNTAARAAPQYRALTPPRTETQGDGEAGVEARREGEAGVQVRREGEAGVEVRREGEAGVEVRRDGEAGVEVRRGGAPGGEVRRGGAPGVEVRRDGGPGVELRRDGEAGVRLLAELAEAAIDLLASPDAGKVRACEGPGCSLLFLPAHPRRRWCSPAVCGNRARVARYYQRHR